MFWTLVVPAPGPISTEVLPVAEYPLRPRLCVSTVEWVRSMPTDPFWIAVVVPLLAPPPMNTERDFANAPPWFRPIACAWRLTSVSTLWNSLFSTPRSPVNVR